MTNRPSIRLRPLALLVAGCLATSLAVGCADPELERRAAFESSFNAVAAEYSNFVASRLDLLAAQPSAESVAGLRALADKAKSLSGGTPRMQEAAGMLAASIHRTAASIELARAAWLESGEEIVRGMVASASSLASDLEAVADAAEATDFAGARKPADAAKSASARESRRLQEAMRAIERPLEALVADVNAGATRLSQLDQEAAVLLRKARESAPAAGFAFVEEASKIQGEARAVRAGTAAADIEADRLASDLTVAKSLAAAASGLQAAAGSALEMVGAVEGDVDASAAKCRELAAELRKASATMMKALGDERAGALRDAYAAARTDLEDALADAGSGPAADALRNALVVDELRMRAGELAGIAADGRLVASVAGESAPEFASIRSAAEERIAALKERAAAAAEAAASLPEDESLAGFKAFVDGVKKNSESLTVATLLAPPVAAPKSASTKAAPSTGRSTSGAEVDPGAITDIEGFIATLNAMNEGGQYEAVADAIVASVDDSTDLGRTMKDMTGRMMRAMIPLTKALESKFGVRSLDLGAGVPGGGRMGVGTMTIESNDGEFAEIGGSGTEKLVFHKSGGVWKIDFAEAMRRRGMSDDQIAMAGPAMAMMGDQLARVMKKAMDDVAAGIESGEYATAEAAQQALVEKMMGAMGGLGGGLGGGRGRGGPSGG